jgi:hypothetical protein
MRKLFTLARRAHSAVTSAIPGDLRARSGERPARAPYPFNARTLSAGRAVVASLYPFYAWLSEKSPPPSTTGLPIAPRWSARFE